MTNAIIPQGWCAVRISDVSFKGAQRKPSADEEFTYVDIGSIDRKLKKISEPQSIIGADAPSRARKAINSGDVLVSLTRPNLNAVALVPPELDGQIASTGFEVIKTIGVDSRYVFGLTKSKDFIESISGVVQGALYPAAKSSDVQAYEFALPPLAEQKIIADKLDSLLAQVETTKARLDRIPEILKRFRQSVLAAAVSGRLTEEWRKGSVFGEQILLGNVIDNGPQNGLYKPAKFYGRGVKIIRIDGFYDGEVISWSELKRVEVEPSDLQKWKLDLGDILVNRVNSIEYLGKCALVREIPEEVVFESNIMRFSIDLTKAIPDFIVLFLRSLNGLEELRKNAKLAVNQASINQTDVKSCELLLPCIEEQTEIVRRVEELFAYADAVEKKAQAASERVNNLTQSILAKAFRGDLTKDWRAANPDFISGENSAEALLEKIKVEREALKPKKKPRKQKA